MAAIPTKPAFFEQIENPEIEGIVDDSEQEMFEEFPPVPGPITTETSPRQDADAQLILSLERMRIENEEETLIPVKLPGARFDPNSKNSQKLAKRTRSTLSPAALMFRNRFITEFLVDWDPEGAWIRAGGGGDPSQYAAKGRKLIREGYVARKIYEMIDILEEKELITRNRVIVGLVREANFHGHNASHSARVAAFGKLASILGMEQTNVNIKGNIDHMHRGGVMVVPVVPGTDTWEQLAGASQKKLKEDVRT